MDGGETRRTALPDRAVAPLKVFLLGRFEVVRGDAPIAPQAWRRRRPADLLKLMALAPGRSLRRDEAIQALWPDKDPASGANNLHRALYDLRQIVGGRWVDLEHGIIGMHPDIWVDVDDFEAGASSALTSDREAAVALYRGDLSPEDHVSPWLAARRARLRELMAGAAMPLARAAAARGDALAAIPILRRVIDADASSEEPHRLMIRLLAEMGRRADALRQYDACEAALRGRSLGEPSPELRALRDAVQQGDIGPTHSRIAYDGHRRAARRLLGTAEPPPLRGRTGSLLLFESLVEQGWGSLILLGERGVGKSRLAVEGARIAQEAGAIVLTGLFDPTRAAPYATFADLFADYHRAGGNAGQDPFESCARLRDSAEAESAVLLAAVRAQLAAIGGGRPLYVLLDDLHRADESSANLFHFLARSARALRLMLVSTCREDAVHAGTPVQMLLSHLDCERLARGVRVQRLDLAASRQQLSDILGTAPSEALAEQFYRVTDGSPFYTEELARAFKESGVKVPDDPVVAVRDRVARLGRRAVALLEAAAVAGRRFDFELVKPATGLTGHEALTALDQVLEARIVDEDGGGHHFHHSLVREAVFAALSPARRVELHRSIADAIEARAATAVGGIDDASEPLAYHRRHGDQPGRALGHLVAAGHRAVARAGLREASAFYEAALAAADAAAAPGPLRLEILEALGQLQLSLAELPGALRTFEAASALADVSGWRPGPTQRARARRGAALALLAGGRSAEALAQLESGLDDALLGPGDERAELLLLMSEIAWHGGRPRDAFEAARRCVEEARRVGDEGLGARGREMVALAAAAVGERIAGEPLAADDGPRPPFDPHLVLWEQQLLGDATCAEIGRRLDAFRERAVRRGAPASLALARVMEGILASRAGPIDLAEPALREGQALFQRAGSALGEAFALDALATLLTGRGRVDEALALIGEGVVVAERASLRRHALMRLHATLIRNRLAAGAVYAAEDAAREASALATRHGDCAVCHALFRPEMIRVEILRRRLPDAESDAAELEAIAQRHRGRSLMAVAWKARGRVLEAQGRHADAAATYASAAAAWGALGASFEEARALRLGSRALAAGADPGRHGEAEDLARRAADVLGAATGDDA